MLDQYNIRRTKCARAGCSECEEFYPSNHAEGFEQTRCAYCGHFAHEHESKSKCAGCTCTTFDMGRMDLNIVLQMTAREREELRCASCNHVLALHGEKKEHREQKEQKEPREQKRAVPPPRPPRAIHRRNFSYVPQMPPLEEVPQRRRRPMTLFEMSSSGLTDKLTPRDNPSLKRYSSQRRTLDLSHVCPQCGKRPLYCDEYSGKFFDYCGQQCARAAGSLVR